MRASRSPSSRSPRRPRSCCFREEPADVLLLEVGLGGQFDATNVIDQSGGRRRHVDRTRPRGISRHHARRHRAREGRHLQARLPGRHRAAGLPAGRRRPCEPRRERIGASPILVGAQDFSVHEEARTSRLSGRGRAARSAAAAACRSPSVHQCRDCDRGPARGRLRAVRDLAFEAGMSRAEWPGRLQRLARGRLPGLAPEGCELWLDGGHNPDGGRVLAAAMADHSENERRAPRAHRRHARHQGFRRLLPQLSRPRARGHRRADHRPDRRAPGRRGRGDRRRRSASRRRSNRASKPPCARFTIMSGTARRGS